MKKILTDIQATFLFFSHDFQNWPFGLFFVSTFLILDQG